MCIGEWFVPSSHIPGKRFGKFSFPGTFLVYEPNGKTQLSDIFSNVHRQNCISRSVAHFPSSSRLAIRFDIKLFCMSSIVYWNSNRLVCMYICYITVQNERLNSETRIEMRQGSMLTFFSIVKSFYTYTTIPETFCFFSKVTVIDIHTNRWINFQFNFCF